MNVALNLPASENNVRIQDKFPSNTSLWLVLRKFEEGVAGASSSRPKLNLTQRGVPSTDSGAGRLNYEQPCLNIMGRELSSFTDLQKTLAQLGYNSGSVLLRLSFKQDGTPMDEAMAQISNFFNSILPATASSQQANAASSGAHADVEMTSVPDASADNAAIPQEGQAGPEPSEDVVMTPAPPADEFPVQTSADDVLASSSITAPPSTESQSPSLQKDGPSSSGPTTEPTATSSTTQPQQPKIKVYSAPSGNTPHAALQSYNPSDFSPSIEHAHAHQAVLNRLAQNKRLQSDRELESAASTKKQTLASIKSVTIRVRFPDTMVVEADYTNQDTVADLYAKIKTMMNKPERRFELKYQGNNIKMETLDPASNARLITDLGFVGKVLVTMLWHDSVDAADRKEPVLNEEFRAQATEMSIPEPVAAELDEPAVQKTKTQDEKKADAKKKNLGSKADVEARMKKMLGFGRK